MNMTLLVKRSAPLRTIITSPMEERENVSLLLGVLSTAVGRCSGVELRHDDVLTYL